MDTPTLGRTLIYLGLLIAVLGIVVMAAGKIPFLGRLPGDILIKRDHFTFYFPITTCVVISLLFFAVSRFFGPK